MEISNQEGMATSGNEGILESCQNLPPDLPSRDFLTLFGI